LARLVQSHRLVKPFPHHYRVEVSTPIEGAVILRSGALPPLTTLPPEEFDGPGDRWSPETLLVASVADCFALTFRAMARASGLVWTHLRLSASGMVERTADGPRFTAIDLDAALSTPPDVSESLARRLLEKAEHGCLVSRSLAFPVRVQPRIEPGEN
jgi:organic hydroperoxide reductase OsmC/OhrA